MIVTHNDVVEIYRKYITADKSFSQYDVTFPEGVNELDPLLLLEFINGETTVTQKLSITSKLIESKKVEIMEGEKKILGFTFNGEGQISMLFSEKPYLLQVLIDHGYALILKKLTPPSPVSSEEVSEEKK